MPASTRASFSAICVAVSPALRCVVSSRPSRPSSRRSTLASSSPETAVEPRLELAERPVEPAERASDLPAQHPGEQHAAGHEDDREEYEHEGDDDHRVDER